MTEQVDILIIGGGLTGASLMLSLANKGFSTLLVEANAFTDKTTADFDARTLALSPASVRILQMLAIWPLLIEHATPINSIHVSEQGHFGTTLLDNNSSDTLGFVVEMQHINCALLKLLNPRQLISPAKLIALDKSSGLATISEQNIERHIKAKLIVAADGAQSAVRQLAGMNVKTKDYHQQAIVANIGLNRPHKNVAYERFTQSGPLALLPMTEQRASLVWALRPHDVSRLMKMPDADFLKNLQRAFGYRIGRLVKVGKRHVYPLKQVVMPQQTAWPLVFVGNAAHTLHPVAGQGFNLGLRDIATLAECIVEFGINASMLEHYQTKRRYDQTLITRFTDGLVDVFTSQMPGLSLLRSLGLVAVDNISGLKKLLAHHAQGFGGVSPDLVCGLTLKDREKNDTHM